MLRVAIALELFKRRSGSYPLQLSELVPTYLSEVPRDPIDGEPLRYKIRDSKPLIYSIGSDKKDDGGVAPRNAMLRVTGSSIRCRRSRRIEDGPTGRSQKWRQPVGQLLAEPLPHDD